MNADLSLSEFALYTICYRVIKIGTCNCFFPKINVLPNSMVRDKLEEKLFRVHSTKRRNVEIEGRREKEAVDCYVGVYDSEDLIKDDLD
jgi:hypothetical protein